MSRGSDPPRWRWRVCGAAAVAALCVACAATDKAAAPLPAAPIQLSIATRTHGSGPVAAFAEQVAALSDGHVALLVRSDAHRELGVDSDAAVLDDVVAGRVDLGAVSIATLQARGVTSFDAFTAPGLVTSVDAEAAVAGGPIGARSLAGAERAGVVGVALVPGPIHHLAITGTPASDINDLAGTTFRVVATSSLAAKAVQAMGAVPTLDDRADRLSVDAAAFDASLATVITRLVADARATFASNIPLWPQPTVIVASRPLFDRLDPETARALMLAGRESAHLQGEYLRRSEGEALDVLCRSTSWTIAPLSTRLVSQIASAVAVVTDRLAADPSLSPSVADVRGAAGETAAVVPRCPSGGSSPTQDVGAPPDSLVGRWSADVTEEALQRAKPSASEEGEIGRWEVTIEADGRIEFVEPAGSRQQARGYVTGELLRITITDASQDFGPGEIWQYRWSVLRGALTFERRPGDGVQAGPTALVSQPFVRLE